MSVPTFPDATAQEKFMLMLLERVDAVTEELHVVKEELADTRTQLADTRAQLVAPLRNVSIDDGGLHSSRWFMYVVVVQPLAADVFARRVLGIVPKASVIAVSVAEQRTGTHVIQAYIDAGSYVNMTVTVNAIDAAIADHTHFPGKMNIVVVRLGKFEDAAFMQRDLVRLQMTVSGLGYGTQYQLSATGDLKESIVMPVELSEAARTQRRGFM